MHEIENVKDIQVIRFAITPVMHQSAAGFFFFTLNGDRNQSQNLVLF